MMTAGSWSRAARLVPAVVAGFLVVPVPIPLPTNLPAQLSTILVTPPLPTPSIPAVLPTPSPPALTQSGGSAPNQAAGSRPAATSSAPTAAAQHGVSIPFTAIYVSSPIDLALIGALITLPLLFAIWLLLFGRTFTEARKARDAQTRLVLAADLGLRPRDLTSMNTKALFSLREKAAFDELTGVMRRAAGIGAAEREISRARRHNAPLTVAFIDVDGLKEANDRKGHASGDKLLRRLAEALKDGLRGEDIVLRYGGDEFVCVLPDTTAGAARDKFGEIQVEAAKSGVRFCVGLAQLTRSDDVVSLFARADRDLYDFKANRGEIVRLPSAGGSKTEPKHGRMTMS